MKIRKFALCLPLIALATPAAAEVVAVSERSFITHDEAVVEADPKQVWLQLISPARWWNSAHTWSGDAANLTLKPQAGGCFCERIPESSDMTRITLEGSVEHLRVIHAFPESALRMSGALGPLQSEPVTGVLTIVLSPNKDGTKIVWEYAVSGAMRFELPTISKAVDGVMTEQLDRLAASLGRVDTPRKAAAEQPAEDEEGKAVEAGPEKSDREKALEEAIGELDDTPGGD